MHFKLIKPSILLTRGTQMTGCRRLSLSDKLPEDTWVARGFQQLDEVHNPFIQRPFFCRTHHPLTNAEQALVSGQVSHLPPPIHLPGNLRADMEESDLNELA